jgi:hypothetical protein
MVTARKSETRYLTSDDAGLQLSATLRWYESEYRKKRVVWPPWGRPGVPVLVAGRASTSSSLER